MSNLEHRYQVGLTKSEIETILAYIGHALMEPTHELVERFERRLRQIRSHEEMLEAYDSFDSIDTGL